MNPTTDSGSKDYAVIFQFIKDIWPSVLGLLSVWKLIDRIFKHIEIRRKDEINQLIKLQVDPLLDKIDKMMDMIRELKEERL